MFEKFGLAALKVNTRPKPEVKETTDVETKPEDEYPHGARLILTAISLGMTIFLVALDGTIVSTAIPAITDEFHSLNDLGWVS